MNAVEFTQRERAIIRLAAKGLITQEIALRLYLSLDTVELYMRNIVKKLNAKSINECIAKAVKMNLL